MVCIADQMPSIDFGDKMPYSFLYGDQFAAKGAPLSFAVLELLGPEAEGLPVVVLVLGQAAGHAGQRGVRGQGERQARVRMGKLGRKHEHLFGIVKVLL